MPHCEEGISHAIITLTLRGNNMKAEVLLTVKYSLAGEI